MLQKKLKRGENFAFSRYSDGEMLIMQNKHLKLDSEKTIVQGEKAGIGYDKSDHKEFDPEKHGWLREHLIEAYKHHQDGYYVGLSCPCCVGKEQNSWMKELRGSDDEHLTWANLFLNSNYPLFLNHVLPLLKNREVFIVCNEAADIENLPFPTFMSATVGSNAMINDIDIIARLSAYIELEKYENVVFLFAAASLSNLAIYELYKVFPRNTYIDIGTTLNPHMKLPVARNYLKGYWLNSGNTEIHKECVW